MDILTIDLNHHLYLLNTSNAQFNIWTVTGTDIENIITNAYNNTLTQIISLISGGDARGDQIFKAILSPCQLIAGAGAMYWLVPIIMQTQRLEDLRDNLPKIIGLFLIALLFVQGAKAGRAVAVANYALIEGINSAMKQNLSNAINAPTLSTNLGQDNQKINNINAQSQACTAVKPTIIDSNTGQSIPNPERTKCTANLKSSLQGSNFNNPNTQAVANTSASNDNPFDIGAQFTKSLNSTIQELLSTILNAWQEMIAFLSTLAFIMALLFFPIPLAFSFINASPLRNWFCSLWAIGFFQFSLTILSGMILFFNASMGAGNVPLYSMELVAAIGAPFIAAYIASEGAKGLFSLLEKAAEATIGILTKAIAVFI